MSAPPKPVRQDVMVVVVCTVSANESEVLGRLGLNEGPPMGGMVTVLVQAPV